MHRVKLFCLLSILPSLLFALPEDRDQPISLKADSASFDQRTGVSTYQGHVEINQGTMNLAADKATVYFTNEGTFQRMEAEGAPSRFRYQPSRNKPHIEGVGKRIVYNAAKAEVVVSGKAHFVQGRDEFTGPVIVYDLTKDVVNASGGVQFIIHPTKKTDN